MAILGAIVAALQAFPAAVKLFDMFSAMWISYQKGQTREAFERRSRDRLKLIERLKAAESDDDIARRFEDLINRDS